MTIRDDLLELLGQGEPLTVEDYRTFFRDHGPALVEALADQDRLLWTIENRTDTNARAFREAIDRVREGVC